MQSQNENDSIESPDQGRVAPLSADQLNVLLRYIDARIVDLGSPPGNARPQTRQRIRAEQMLYRLFGIE